MVRALIVFWLVCIGGVTSAAPVTVRVLTVDGDLALGSELPGALAYCSDRLPVRVRWEIRPATYGGPALTLEDRYEVWRYWSARFGTRLARHADVPRLVVMPPLWADNVSWMAGYGTVGSYGREIGQALAVVFAGYRNAAGENRVNASGVLICHELGHVLGADHTPDCSIMHPDAMRCWKGNGNMQFSSASTIEMLRHVRKVSRYNKR